MFKFRKLCYLCDVKIRSCSTHSFNNVRVRFAPSPTGFLHLGGLRTALYNFLFARTHQGKFILRIEDTDQTRLVDGAIEQIQRDLNWAGIEIDEGPLIDGPSGPYIQSERLNIYKENVKTLLENKTAYYCFCTERRLELLRKEALRTREIPKYDNRCRHLKSEEIQEKLSQGLNYCIRFKLNPGPETFKDMIYGDITYDTASNESDPVIMKSDGYPTYHFANVVDDHLMQISHVLRGVEWQISTPKHILLYKAFNWKPPQFGHLPLLMNADGTKLSKRQGDIKIDYYRQNGIFPQALLNYIVTSGGGFQKQENLKQQCYTIQGLSQKFDISRISNHSGKLMTDLLEDFNRLELKRKLGNEQEESELIEQVRKMINENYKNAESLDASVEHIKHILHWSTDRITKLGDLFSKDLKFIWVTPKSGMLKKEEVEWMDKLIRDFSNIHFVSKEELNVFFKEFCEKNQIKFNYFMKTLRTVLSGLKEGPSVAEMVEILGKENSMHRLESSVQQNLR